MDCPSGVLPAVDEGTADFSEGSLSPFKNCTRETWTPLLRAALFGHTDILRQLVELGVPFTRTAAGYSALHVAAMNGHVNSTSFLLEYILPDEKDNFGRTSLMGATRGGYPDVVDVLVRGGASLDMQDNSGVTALAHTARFDDLLHVAERLTALAHTA